MRFVRLFLRGLKDAYHQLVITMMISVLWWICALLIITGPPATVALFRMADPRNQVEQPEFGQFFRTMKDYFATSWAITGFTVPVILILAWNSIFFRGTSSGFALLVPLWVVMIFITIMLMLYAFATAATMESRTRNAFKGAAFQLVMRPFTSALMALLVFAILGVFGFLILPLVVFGPGLAASVINRFVLATYNVEVIDPSSPTQERSHEVARGGDTDGMRGWMQRGRGNARQERNR